MRRRTPRDDVAQAIGRVVVRVVAHLDGGHEAEPLEATHVPSDGAGGPREGLHEVPLPDAGPSVDGAQQPRGRGVAQEGEHGRIPVMEPPDREEASAAPLADGGDQAATFEDAQVVAEASVGNP